MKGVRWISIGAFAILCNLESALSPTLFASANARRIYWEREACAGGAVAARGVTAKVGGSTGLPPTVR